MFDSIATNITDLFIYIAIAIVFITGLVKCVFPVRHAAGRLRRGIRILENDSVAGPEKPAWQEVQFLGKKLQHAWSRFLQNAEQLDARGLSCNIENYINDDSVICSVGHVQLSEVIPGLLTSLGILGTFIGLIRGLGGLDVSNAEKTMESIPAMIGGMTFAFSTSIVGVACSLAFNILNRMSQGNAVNAIDEFNDAFTDLVMKRPLDEDVMMLCQQRDRDVFLRRFSGDMGNSLSNGVRDAVEQSLLPISQTINQFVLGQTQSQIDGIALISQQFVVQMNRALNSQLQQLSDMLNISTQQQSANLQALQSTMHTADEMLKDLKRLEYGTEQVTQKFSDFIEHADNSQRSGDGFLVHSSQVLSGMLSAGEEQMAMLERIKNQQQQLSDALAAESGNQGRFSQQSSEAAQKMSAAAVSIEDAVHSLNSQSQTLLKEIREAVKASVDGYKNNIDQILGVLQLRTALDGRDMKAENVSVLSEQKSIQQLLVDMAAMLESICKDMKLKGVS